ncbi:hypothetical protein pb186bvf_010289 [Paramecium bursaria]
MNSQYSSIILYRKYLNINLSIVFLDKRQLILKQLHSKTYAYSLSNKWILKNLTILTILKSINIYSFSV